MQSKGMGMNMNGSRFMIGREPQWVQRAGVGLVMVETQCSLLAVRGECTGHVMVWG